MGWFSKNEKKEEKKGPGQSLPELPRLPELPKIGENNSQPSIPQLPSFPNTSLGEKFSQNTIKEAITGKKEGEEVFDADEFAEDELQRMQKPLKIPRTKELSGGRIPKEFEEVAKIVRKNEPIFIRIDKFEEGLHVFEKTKKKVHEIEKMLHDIKKLKEEEEKELSAWEAEIQAIKAQIEKVDQDIFSKVE